VLRYAPEQYQLVVLAADLLGVRAGDLSRLHELALDQCRQPLHPMLSRAFKRAGLHQAKATGYAQAVQHSYGEHGDSSRPCDARQQRFLAAFRSFCADVVAPSCCGESRRVACQSPPTLRISLPGSPPTISLHSDQVYDNHTAAEVNWWLPLTPVFGSNTLWLESHPGAADYRPVTLHPGEVLRFNGYECRHYTLANETCASRVSIDWRAVPAELAPTPFTCVGEFGGLIWVDAPDEPDEAASNASVPEQTRSSRRHVAS
jgi:hypothetical protein